MHTPDSSTSFPIEVGTETTFNNPHPAHTLVTIETREGSFIRFDVPAGESFTFKSAGDLSSVSIDVHYKGDGPRPIE